MKLVILCVCVLHLTLVRSSPKPKNRNIWLSDAQTPQSKGSWGQGRVGPLFARRGQYERQRIHIPKAVMVPRSRNDVLHAKVERKPAKSGCSPLSQSCSPLSGCCDSCATCHCRFFSAICFCRKANGQHERKKKTNGTSVKGRHSQILTSSP